MRRTVIGILFVAHGLAHSALGMFSAGRGPDWLVTPLWWLAEAGFVAAGLGLIGVSVFRKAWEPLAIVATVSSIIMFGLFGDLALMVGLLVDLVILVAGLSAGESALLARGTPRARGERPAHPVRHTAFTMIGGAFVLYITATILLRPWNLDWGTTMVERQLRLPGDELVPEANYRMDHAVTIRAPADSVWPWLVQIGQDRAGFYSYDGLERLFGARIRNADRIHPEWQTRREGELVRATQADYLGGRLGTELGWRVAEVQEGRAMVLRGWGAFVVRPIDATTSRLQIRLRGAGRPTIAGTLVAPFDLLVFEPAHFVMERGMLLGIKARAEGATRPSNTTAD